MNANGSASGPGTRVGSREVERRCSRDDDPLRDKPLFGVFTHASPAPMALYQVPAFGLSPILNSRSNVA
jgi:hypothetical protein